MSSEVSTPGGQLANQTGAAKAWAVRAQEAGWLSDAAVLDITGLSGATSADLFAPGVDSASKPLVVALFGGTGVGKSSVLNRLVGENIAKVGVIRPTSLEATVYVHEAINFSRRSRLVFSARHIRTIGAVTLCGLTRRMLTARRHTIAIWCSVFCPLSTF